MVQPSETGTGGGGGLTGGLRVLLFASLALNLLVVGALVGAGLWGGWGHGHHGPGLDAAGGPMTRALSREDRRAISQRMRQAYRDGRPGRAAHRAAFEALLDDLRAEPFQRAAVEAHMARMRGLLTDRLELGQTLLLDRLEAMSPSERAAFADRLEHGRHPHHGQRDGG